MGGGGQANSGQATQAANQQTAASNAEMQLAKQNSDLQKRMVGTLFGSGAPGSTGTLSGMMDPSSINQKGLNPAYQTQFNEGSNQLGRDYANQRGSLAQSFANSGATSSSTPNGFQSDQMRKLGSSAADARGSLYAGLKGSQYSDALNNFWNANNIASGNAASSGSTAAGALGGAGSSSASIYGTAGQYHPSQFGSVMGSALQAGGAVGAGAATHCPSIAAMVLMADGSEKMAKMLQPGDLLRGIDGEACIVESAFIYPATAVSFKTFDGCAGTASVSHALITPGGGFVICFESIGGTVRTKLGTSKVIELVLLGKRFVVDILTDRSHSYCADGIWAWGTRDEPSDVYLNEPATLSKLAAVEGK